MDEITMLGTALAEAEPSPDAVDRSRHRLQNTMRGGRGEPARKKRWIAAGAAAGLTAAAVAAAVVVSDPSAPDTGKDRALSGRQVMLAAATTAESKPASSGTYWHTKVVSKVGKVTDVTETWIRRDGRTWLSAAPGLVSRVENRPLIRGTRLDFAGIQRLPADPGRLKAALLDSTLRPISREQRNLFTINMLQEVLVAPAPPKVRAAAYRALAALPHIANLGRTSGGYRLKISYMDGTGTRVDGTETIIVDPETAQLRVGGWAGFGGGGVPAGPSQSTSGWTDRLSGRIVPWSKQVPYIDKLNKQFDAQNH